MKCQCAQRTKNFCKVCLGLLLKTTCVSSKIVNVSLMDSDFNKLRLLKKADGESDMTYNDFAEELLSRMIRRMYREYDRQGLIKEDEDD